MRYGKDLPSGIVVALLIATACSPLNRRPPREPEAADGVSQGNGAVVVAGSALRDGPGSVLSAISGKVPNLRIRRLSEACPQLTLRSYSSFSGLTNPHVYVDGTRATDTCILETLRAQDVDRVEVYPLGFTTRPGYGTHSHGLILVFMRSA